jgi:hypothetical protein
MAACIAALFLATLHWPTIGDSSLMHYAVFLMDRGAAPYRDIYEMNLPGSYFVEWLAMHSFGPGPLAWRLFDFSSSLAVLAAMVVIAWPVDWLAGFWAGALFLLIHGQDGIFQVGQRDLSAAVCLLAGYSFLFVALRTRRPSPAFVFGLLGALAATIKPTFAPVVPVSLLLVSLQLRRERSPFSRFVIAGLAGYALPWAGVVIFLWRERALGSFAHIAIPMMAYHASLSRRPVGYLLLHSLSPILPIVAICLPIAALQRRRPTWEDLHLWVGVFFGGLSYLAQGKGYPYQRYPLLAFLLAIIALQLSRALRQPGIARNLGILGLGFGTLFLAPESTIQASRYDAKNLGILTTMEQDLRGLGDATLLEGVQCVDSIAGCTGVLYRMKLPEISPVFYDEFLFGPAGQAAVAQNRDKFWRDLQTHPPAVIVVTAPLFPGGPNNYEKLRQWPAFDQYLRQEYSLHLERSPSIPVRWWSRPEVPPGYRIYLRNGDKPASGK